MKRNNTADFLKGIAVILMIQVHVMELFAQPDVFESSIGKLSLFLGGVPVAPLFLAIMGYYTFQTRKSTSDIFYRGIKLILLGIALSIGLNAHLFYTIFTGSIQLNPFELIFGIDIFICAGFSMLFIAVCKKKLLQFSWLTPVFIALILLLSQLVNHLNIQHPFYKYFIAIFGGQYKWSYFPLFPWLAYTLTGGLFFLIQDKIKITTNMLISVFIAGLVYTGFTIKYAIAVSHNLPAYYHHEFMFYFWAIGFLIFWISTCRLIEKYMDTGIFLNAINLLGRKVTIAYVFQWIIIGNIATSLYRNLSLIQSTISFIVILILTFGVVFFADKYKRKSEIIK